MLAQTGFLKIGRDEPILQYGECVVAAAADGEKGGAVGVRGLAIAILTLVASSSNSSVFLAENITMILREGVGGGI